MLEEHLSTILKGNEADLDRLKQETEQQQKKPKKKLNWKTLAISLLLFIIAAGIRIYFLYFIEDPQNSHPGWYEDTYHHWQIAYLSLTTGFKVSFLRLWDLKGMEYFWGLLHPLTLALLMKITGIVSIVVARWLSLICGSVSVVLVWLIVKRFFGWQAGLAAAIIAFLNPVAIYSDTSGMQEPLGIVLLLSGLYFWPAKAIAAGVFWMLAGMVRAEYWLIGIGLWLVTLFTRQKPDKKLFVSLGYILPMLIYMKYLLDKTGNAIYPMYWNFMGNMKGEWQAAVSPNASQLMVQKIYIAILMASLISGLILLWKKPKFMPFFALGLGNWVILSITIGLSKYLLSYLPRFWVDRIMLLPYIYLAVWLSAGLFWAFKRRFLSIFAWLIVLAAVSGSQLLWQPIWHWREVTKGQWESKQALAETVAKYYQGGKILLFEDHPASTYWLVYKGGVNGSNIIGQMFDPYFYMEGDAYLNWGENKEIIYNWLREEDIRLMAFFSNRDRYMELVKRDPDAFTQTDFDNRWNLYIYRVDQDKLEPS